jgi:DnaJ-domain-containing protein 1
MSKEQAFKILKVSPATSWEQIEQSRRELVARAQPDKLAGLSAEKRRALQDECRQVNAAYKSLLQTKS